MKGDRVDPFKVDENGMTSDGYHRLDPVSKKSMYIGNMIAIAIAAIAMAAVYVFAPDISQDHSEYLRLSALALLAVIVAYCLVSPQITFMRYRYRIDGDKVDIRRGILYITHNMVPIERIHQVDVSRGPINRIFGLANVTITTAGGTVSIEYLKEDVAEAIAEKLNETVIGILKERV